MKIAIFIPASAALLTGLRAAQLWYRSSVIIPIPTWAANSGIEPGVLISSQMGELAGVIDAATKAAALNANAARWTAISLAMGTATTIVGIFGG